MTTPADHSIFHDLGLLGMLLFGGCAAVALGGWLLGLPFGGADESPVRIYLELAGPASILWLVLAAVGLGRDVLA